jgi:hypothetical protein
MNRVEKLIIEPVGRSGGIVDDRRCNAAAPRLDIGGAL